MLFQFTQLERAPAHWTICVVVVGQPSLNAMHVKMVRTFPPRRRTAFPWNRAGLATHVKRLVTNGTLLVCCVPSPNCYRVKRLDCHFHLRKRYVGEQELRTCNNYSETTGSTTTAVPYAITSLAVGAILLVTSLAQIIAFASIFEALSRILSKASCLDSCSRLV